MPREAARQRVANALAGTGHQRTPAAEINKGVPMVLPPRPAKRAARVRPPAFELPVSVRHAFKRLPAWTTGFNSPSNSTRRSFIATDHRRRPTALVKSHRNGASSRTARSELCLEIYTKRTPVAQGCREIIVIIDEVLLIKDIVSDCVDLPVFGPASGLQVDNYSRVDLIMRQHAKARHIVWTCTWHRRRHRCRSGTRSALQRCQPTTPEPRETADRRGR